MQSCWGLFYERKYITITLNGLGGDVRVPHHAQPLPQGGASGWFPWPGLPCVPLQLQRPALRNPSWEGCHCSLGFGPVTHITHDCQRGLELSFTLTHPVLSMCVSCSVHFQVYSLFIVAAQWRGNNCFCDQQSTHRHLEQISMGCVEFKVNWESAFTVMVLTSNFCPQWLFLVTHSLIRNSVKSYAISI